MAEPKRILLEYQVLVKQMIRDNDVHEGIWGLYLRAGIQVTNALAAMVGSANETPKLTPTIVCPILEIGIQEYDSVNELSLDAAVVNPKRSTKKAGKKGKARK